MTKDKMSARISNFVDDPNNVIFTDDNGIVWFEVHTFSQEVLITNRTNAYQILCNVNKEFRDELTPFTKYVKSRGEVVKLFDSGGTGYTPVMTVYGLLEFTMRIPNNEMAKHVRELAAKCLADYIIGDRNHINNAKKNAAMSEPIQQLLRQARDQQHGSGGASIAEPFAQVLDAHMMCCCCNCSDFDPRCRARLSWQ
jgi:hypothetical protein